MDRQVPRAFALENPAGVHPVAQKPWRNAAKTNASSSGRLVLRNPIAACCARAASGHAAAAAEALLKFIYHQHPPSSAPRRILTMVFDRLNNALEQLDLALLGGSGDHKPA